MKKLIIIFLMLYLALIEAEAQTWTITQITNTSYNEYGVRLYNNHLTWMGNPVSGSLDIFYYDGSVSRQLTKSNGLYNYFPQISSGGIVWTNTSSSSSTSGDAMFYNFNTISDIGNVAIASNRISNINIYGNTVVFSDSLNRQLTLFDGTNTTKITGAYGLRPRISSGGIIYSDDSINDHLYLYDWNSVTDLGSTTDSDSQSVTGSIGPQINGSKVTWFQNSGIYEINEVMLMDTTTGAPAQLTNGNIQYGQPSQPVVSGNYVAWMDMGRGGLQPIKLYDGQQVLTIAQTIGNAWLSFGDGFLAFSMIQDSQIDLFVYDLSTKTITQVTNDSLVEEDIVASGNYIAYHGYNGSQTDVFLASTTTVVPEPISGCVDLDGAPLKNRKVILKQTDEVNQTTTTDSGGCYGFIDAASGKAFTVQINGPVLTSPVPVIHGCADLQGSPMSGRRVLLKQMNELNKSKKTGADGCYSFTNAVPDKNFKVLIKGPVVP